MLSNILGEIIGIGTTIGVMSWLRGVEKLAWALASVDVSRLPRWGPKDKDYCWSEMLRSESKSKSVTRTLFGKSVELRKN